MSVGLEVKFAGGTVAPVMTDEAVIEGYASLFGMPDQGGDVVLAGAYRAGLARLAAKGGKVRMLWQHDAGQPIGVWEEIREDARGLWVRGRLLLEVAQAREAAALVRAGAIDGLSIGYRTVKAEKGPEGGRRLSEVELWEVSLVTFPMLADARVGAGAAPAPQVKAADEDALAEVFDLATAMLRAGR